MSGEQLISVIVPCYNQAAYLSETLESVYNQTYTNWECFIINDGSTDDTQMVAQRWLEKDSRFKYIFQENRGLSSARNTGLDAASGEIIQLLDSDDLIKSNKFNTQLQLLENSEVCVCDYFSFVDGNIEEKAKHRYLSPFLENETFKGEIIRDWEYRKSIPCHAILFKRTLISKNQIAFNETLSNHEDWHFWCRVFYFSSSISNCNEILAYYRIREKSMSSDHRMMYQGFLEVANLLLSFYQKHNEENLVKLVRLKKKEIKHRNSRPLFKRLKSILKSKLLDIYHYAFKKN